MRPRAKIGLRAGKEMAQDDGESAEAIGGMKVTVVAGFSHAVVHYRHGRFWLGSLAGGAAIDPVLLCNRAGSPGGVPSHGGQPTNAGDLHGHQLGEPDLL